MLRGGGTKLGLLSLDGPEALAESSPGPGLDLVVAAGPDLGPGDLQVLEPGVGLLDCQCLVNRQQLLGVHALEG